MFHLVSTCFTYAYIPSVSNAYKKNLAYIGKRKGGRGRKEREKKKEK
jgi:hypothetical protein